MWYKLAQLNKEAMISPKLVQEMIRLYQAGTPIENIAKGLSITVDSVMKYLRENRIISPSKESPEMMQSKIPEIIRLYQSGTSISDISKIIGVRSATIMKYLRENAVTVPVKRVIPPMMIQEVISLYQSGISASEISRKFNLAKATVMKLLRDNNVPVLSKEEAWKKKMDEKWGQDKKGPTQKARQRQEQEAEQTRKNKIEDLNRAIQDTYNKSKGTNPFRA